MADPVQKVIETLDQPIPACRQRHHHIHRITTQDWTKISLLRLSDVVLAFPQVGTHCRFARSVGMAGLSKGRIEAIVATAGFILTATLLANGKGKSNLAYQDAGGAWTIRQG